MIIITRLFGFLVVSVLVIATLMVIVESLPNRVMETISPKEIVDELENETEGDVEKNLAIEEAEENVEEFTADIINLKLNSVEFTDLLELKTLLAQKNEVMILIDNELLNNPLLPKNKTVPVVLTGYDQTHFFSNGSEVKGNKFVYLNEDLEDYLLETKGSLWFLAD